MTPGTTPMPMPMPQQPPQPPQPPHPRTRAPRAQATGQVTHDQLSVHPAELQGAVAVLLHRDTRGSGLDDAQRLTHFPASPLLSLSWFQGMEAGLVEARDEQEAHGGARGSGEVAWRPFGASIVVSGSQSRPVTSWAPTTGRGGMACFTADAARQLLGIDPADVHDRFVDARTVMDASWQPLFDDLLAAPDDTATHAAWVRHLAPRWRAVRDGEPVLDALKNLGRHWVDRLAWQAHQWRRTHGARQVERRVKAFSGRSLRDWQALVRTEGAFFAARERREAGLPFDWAAIAQDEGFADQSHLVRASRRITGFAPGEFAQRFDEDEAFWLYRLWV